MPVHLYGQMAPMEAVEALARRARPRGHRGRRAGAGRAAATARAAGTLRRWPAGTSFYPGKNLGAYGDAGAVHHRLRRRSRPSVRALRNYGSEVKYHHPETGLQLAPRHAAGGGAERQAEAPRRLERGAAARGRAATTSCSPACPAVTLPRDARRATSTSGTSTWSASPHRDEVLAKLNADGIGAGIHYPVPIHLQGAFAHLGHGAGDFPVAEQAAAARSCRCRCSPRSPPTSRRAWSTSLRRALGQG